MCDLYFKAELLDDLVLSQKTATVGNHKSLDYIPGSVFLGIAASNFYKILGSEKAWEIFHSSKVHFCNAYPFVNGERSLPIPLSLHSEKVPRAGKENTILNFVYSETKEPKIQYRQSRNGYVCFSDDNKLSVTFPSKTSRMRTAIDARTGTAAKAQLYGYESLDAGQVFIGKIEWDDSVNEIVSPVVSFFTSENIVHAGRSRTASYGRVKISKFDFSSKTDNLGEDLENSFSILAVSDLCIRNLQTGTPELNLFPSSLGLGDNWELDKSKSFSRPSYLYQYNAYRHEIEMQKTLISKGSVFTFKSEEKLTPEEKDKIKAAIKNGVGEAKGQGFGEIALFSIGKKFQREENKKDIVVETPKLSSKEADWLEWLKPDSLHPDIEKKVKFAVNEFINLCKSIKSFYTFGDDDIFWPGNAQWGRILEASRECNSKSQLNNLLFNGENPIIKAISISKTEKHGDIKEKNPDEEWNYEASQSGKTLRKWLCDIINDNSLNDKDTKIALQELAKRCKDKIANKGWLKGENK